MLNVLVMLMVIEMPINHFYLTNSDSACDITSYHQHNKTELAVSLAPNP